MPVDGAGGPRPDFFLCPGSSPFQLRRLSLFFPQIVLYGVGFCRVLFCLSCTVLFTGAIVVVVPFSVSDELPILFYVKLRLLPVGRVIILVDG